LEAGGSCGTPRSQSAQADFANFQRRIHSLRTTAGHSRRSPGPEPIYIIFMRAAVLMAARFQAG